MSDIYLTELDDGTLLAASIGAPRFCFAGKDEEELRAKVERALHFHQSARGERMQSRSGVSQASKQTVIVRPATGYRKISVPVPEAA